MGRYLEIARQFEARRKAGAPSTCSLQRSVSPSSRVPSHQGEHATDATALSDDLPALDAWLCDQHPTLWQQIREVDDQLSAEALNPADYQQKLPILLKLYQQARALKAGQWGALLIRSDVLDGEG